MYIKDKFSENKPCISFEIFPPKAQTPVDTVLSAAGELAALSPAYMSVTCGAGGSQAGSFDTIDTASYIKNELKQHDIDNEIIFKVMDSAKEEKEPYLQIIDIMKKKYSKFDGKDKNEVRKIAMFFQRRGFASQDIAKAFREFDTEIEEDN